MSLGLRIFAGLFAVLFAFGAAVQWNDPDPLRWMLAYGAAAGVSACGAAGRLQLAVTALVFAGLLVWLVIWLPALAHTSLDAVSSFGMSGAIQEEEVREAWGLVLLVAWTGVLLGVSWRRRPR